MNPIFTPEELAELGLEGAAAGEAQALPVPRPSAVARGLDAAGDPRWAHVAERLAEGWGEPALELAPPRPLRVPARLAWSADRERLLVRAEEDILDVRARRGAPAGERRTERFVALPVRQLGDGVLVTFDDGSGLGLRSSPDLSGGLVAGDVVLRPLRVPAPFAEGPDVAAWLPLVAHDPWLAERLAAAAESPWPWRRVVAAGQLDRLVRVPAGEARRRAQAILATGEDDAPRPARSWARSLGPEQADALDRLAAETARLLAEDLDDALDRLDPDSPAWCREMTLLLETRDDLEGAWILCDAAGSAERVGAVLGALDDRMADEVASWPAFPVEPDERLRRGLLASPDGWWVAPLALWDEEREA